MEETGLEVCPDIDFCCLTGLDDVRELGVEKNVLD